MPAVDIKTFTGSGRISNSTRHVYVIEFHARSDNDASVYAGITDITVDVSRELPPNDTFKLNFGDGSVELKVFYGITTGSDKLDWSIIYDDR